MNKGERLTSSSLLVDLSKFCSFLNPKTKRIMNKRTPIRLRGESMQISAKTPTKIKLKCIASDKNKRRGSSEIAVSLENLFIIRPLGFLSKKVELVSVTPSKALLWRFFEELIRPKYKKENLAKPVMYNATIINQKT